MRITGRVTSIAFEHGRIVLSDKDKTTLYCKQSDKLGIAMLAVAKEYIHFEVDGCIIVSFAKAER